MYRRRSIASWPGSSATRKGRRGRIVGDTLTSRERHRCMAAIRGSDTTPERTVRSVLHSMGYRFRLHAPNLPAHPDIVLPRLRAVILVHGCFWHSHVCRRGRSTPATNAAFWREKRAATKTRDRRSAASLRRSGWRVLVIWECQITSQATLAKRLSSFLLTFESPMQHARGSGSRVFKVSSPAVVALSIQRLISGIS